MGAAAGPNIIEDGLVLAFDAGNTKSYPGSGSTSSLTITYVGGTSDSDNSSSFTLSGLQSGDLVLYFSAEDGAAVATPTGASWTAIPGLSTQPDNDGNPHSAAFYVLATGTSVTASGLNTLNENVRVMIAFRNVNSTNPFDVNATENSGNSLPDPPSITPVTDNCMIVAVGLLDDHAIANSISPPTGYTTAVNMDSDGGANDTGLGAATIMTAYKLLATAAAEDPGGFTGTTGDPQKGISIALRPGIISTWTDLSSRNHNATLTGPTYNSDNGGAFIFDGGNDYVTTGNTLTDADELFADTGRAWSVSSWFNVDVISSADKSVISRGGVQGGGNNFLVWVTSSDLKVKLRGGTTTDISTSIAASTWYNVAITWDGTTAKGYLNGQFITTIPVGTASIKTGAENPFCIGITGSDLDNDPFDGKISQVLAHNRALTASEVLQNYNATKGRYGY